MLFAAMMPTSANAQVNITIPDIVGSINQVITIPFSISNVVSGPAIEAWQLFPVSSTANVVFVGGDMVNTLSGTAGTGGCIAVSTGSVLDRCSGFGTNITTDGVLINMQFKFIGPVTEATVSFNNILFNGPGSVAITPLVPVINATLSSLPVTSADTYTVNEGYTLNVNATSGVLANDVSGSAMTASLGTNVSNGTLTLSADGSFVYTHDGSETASDSFTYFATNGSGTSAAVTVIIVVTAEDDTPIAHNGFCS